MRVKERGRRGFKRMEARLSGSSPRLRHINGMTPNMGDAASAALQAKSRRPAKLKKKTVLVNSPFLDTILEQFPRASSFPYLNWLSRVRAG